MHRIFEEPIPDDRDHLVPEQGLRRALAAVIAGLKRWITAADYALDRIER